MKHLQCLAHFKSCTSIGAYYFYMKTLRVREVNLGSPTKPFSLHWTPLPLFVCPGLENEACNRKHQTQQKWHCTEELPVLEAGGALINSPGGEQARAVP